jgi:hypothetical protein
MDGFSVSTRLTLADWKAIVVASSGRTQGRGWRGAALVIGLPVVVVLLFLGLLRLARTAVAAEWLLIGVLLGYGLVFVLFRVIRLWHRPVEGGSFLGEWHYDFSPLGIRIRRKDTDSMWSWSGVREIAFSGDHVFVWTDSITAFLIPVRDLPTGWSGEQAQASLQELKAQVAGQQEAPELGAVVAPSVPVGSGSAPQKPRSLGRSLAALGRWLTWRKFDGRALAAPDGAIVLISLTCFALRIGLEYVNVGPGAEFSWLGAPILAVKALGLLVIGWLMWRTSDPQPAWRTVLFILAALTLVAIPLQWGIEYLKSDPARTTAAWILLVVQLFYLARAFRVVTGYQQLRAIAISLVCLGVGTGFISTYFDDSSLWYVPRDDSADSFEKSNRDIERLLMTQSARIDSAAASMVPRSGDTSLFMVGFAGVGEQKVFAGEISLAAKVIGDRYGTAKRSLLLVNDQRDLESHPLASVTGLKIALADVAQRMDRERDVLILYIASHGSRAPAVSVSNGDVPLSDLTGKDLREAFNEARIRWRVVIISACHAGAFIPYLQDDHTVVITAAAADRTSFGCSNDRDLTYFGEAFVRDALPGSPTLRAAFEKARADIATREKAENIKPSIPTAYFGAAMEEKLQALEKSRAAP